MNERIALCVDRATCQNPHVLGLDDEVLDNQGWLVVFDDAASAREEIAHDTTFQEAWVVSNEEVAPINLAATLKADRPELVVRLVAADAGGSLLSRAHTASIDEIMTPSLFVRAYAKAKQRYGSGSGDAPVGMHSKAIDGFDPMLNADRSECPGDVQYPVPQPAKSDLATSTFLMPVVSGSGGSGKSVVAMFSALIAAKMGLKTLLLDCDLQFGDIAPALGMENALTLEEVLARSDALNRVCHSEGLVLLSAPKRLEAADYLSHEIPRLLSSVAGCFDVIIANTGSSWSECHAALLERASAALFLVDQRASSLRACQHALALCSRCGIATGPFKFALNRCSKGALLNTIDVSCALQGRPVFELREGGRSVEEFVGAGIAAELLEEKNEFCISLQHVLSQLLPEPPGSSAQSVGTDKSRQPRKRARHLLHRSRGSR